MQQAISCVTPSILRGPTGYRRLAERVDLVLGSGEAVRLRGPERTHLRVRLRVRVAQAEPPRGLWDARTAAYEYRLSDQDDREILAYHWHPDGQSHIQTPHLHLGPAAEVGRASLLAAHLPTSSVSLHHVLRLAVESFGVAPVRRDWDRVLGL
jgi:hypothetical protein